MKIPALYAWFRARRSNAAAWVLVFGAVTAAGCGGPSKQTFSNHPNADMAILVTFGGKKPKAFDPRSPDPRVRAAYGQLTKLVGRELDFHFAEALVPKWTSDFDSLFAACIETVAADLALLERSSPKAFELAKRSLAGIEVEYDATAQRRWDSKLSPSGRVVVTLTPEHWSLVPERAVSHALLLAHEELLMEEYGRKDPATLASNELETYFSFLRVHGTEAERLGEKERKPQVLESAEAKVLLKALRLAEVAPEKKASDDLRTRIDAWTMREGLSLLQDAYWHHGALVADAPAPSSFKRAEAAFSAWLARRFRAAPPAERVSIAEKLYDRSLEEVPHERVWPGIDRAALGLAVFEEWRAAGHPIQPDEGPHDDERQRYFDAFVCTHPTDARGMLERRTNGLCQAFYEFMLASSERERTLVGYVLAKRDRMLTEQVFANLDGRRLMSARQAIEGDDREWSVAARVVADRLGYAEKERLLGEVARLWTSSPRKRGALLYTIARIDESQNGAIDWDRFPARLGALAGPADYAAMLELAPYGVRAAGYVVSALSSGWSRVEVAIPRFSRASDDDAAAGARTLARALCKEGNAADLARLAAWAERKVHERPSLDRGLDEVRRAASRGGC